VRYDVHVEVLHTCLVLLSNSFHYFYGAARLRVQLGNALLVVVIPLDAFLLTIGLHYVPCVVAFNIYA